METKKAIIMVIMLGMMGTAIGQRDSVIKNGMIRAHANLSGGYLFHTKNFASYISANCEYYINESFSVIGESWFSFDIVDENEIGLRKNFSGFAGMNYHPVKKSRWDPYVGFNAGLGFFTNNYYQNTLIRESPVQFTPLVGATVGLNYYVGSIFHFFVQCKFVAGGGSSSMYGRTYLHELKLSGGLGWNITTRKRKTKPVGVN